MDSLVFIVFLDRGGGGGNFMGRGGNFGGGNFGRGKCFSQWIQIGGCGQDSVWCSQSNVNLFNLQEDTVVAGEAMEVMGTTGLEEMVCLPKATCLNLFSW